MSLLCRRIGHAWVPGIMLKVTGRLMAGAFTLWPATVYAAAGDGKKPAPAKMSRDDLSLYTAPRQEKAPSAEPKAGQLEQSVATLRKLAEPYTAWCRTTYGRIEPKVQSAVRVGCDTLTFLKNPPGDFYARAGIIGLTGVLGLLLARRSRVKRFIYPAGLMATSGALYYPDKAATIARSAGDTLYEGAVHGYAAMEKIVKPQSKKAEPGGNSQVKR
ncbi:MICOS complex subunit MIC26-like [Syngnathoides biaculeatus]|uniref:MICOS complex subunit MIC26-like n=1 Tax=Syngnathoides biaculeatus TaxID=300417 RepID=UPI002ADD64DC|nr:MICOS complex subunit MIC26-like [Syngnathoides biaculeatus]